MTLGQIMFYGGIAGTVIFAILAAVVWTVFEKKKRRLLRNIEREHME